jgi:hypothetical protein
MWHEQQLYGAGFPTPQMTKAEATLKMDTVDAGEFFRVIVPVCCAYPDPYLRATHEQHELIRPLLILGGHCKSGHRGSPQNRP